MNTVQLNLSALDTLFFKDGKPFQMGEDVWGNGVFPPPPSVLYGALRSLYFSYNLEELHQIYHNQVDNTEQLQIEGISLLSEESPGRKVSYFPWPADLVENKDHIGEIIHLKLQKSGLSNAPCPYILQSPKDKEIKSIEGRFINLRNLNIYLKGEPITRSSTAISWKEFWQQELKLGIAKDFNTGSSKEGALYRLEMSRPKENTYIGIKLNTTGIPGYQSKLGEAGILKIGAEGKAGRYQIDPQAFEAPILPEELSKIIRIYLATPAIFESKDAQHPGWLPAGIDPVTMEGMWKGIRVRVLSAAIGKPQYQGGFDMKTRQYKAMRKTTPAGSVYYLELLDPKSTQADILAAFHGKSVSDSPEIGQQGFGIAYAGILNS